MRQVVTIDGVRIVLISSISEISEQDAGAIIVTGSHAGANVADYALRYPIRAAFFNDAGGGKEDAGIVSLQTLQQNRLPAGAVSHMSARIGDAGDAFANGRLSHINAAAREIGFIVGERLQAALPRCFGCE